MRAIAIVTVGVNAPPPRVTSRPRQGGSPASSLLDERRFDPRQRQPEGLRAPRLSGHYRKRSRQRSCRHDLARSQRLVIGVVGENIDEVAKGTERARAEHM